MKPWRLHLGVVIVTAALGLTGCTSGSDGGSPSVSSPSQPIRIGTLFVPTDSFDPVTATPSGSMLLTFNVYDSLAVMTKKGAALFPTESIELNTTAGEWTVTLRNGLAYLDGTAAARQDVLGSLSHFAQPPSYVTLYSGIDFEASSASGSMATLKLKKPASDFLGSSLGMFSVITPKGKSIGIDAGPFVVDEGSPGTGYQLHANDKYWGGAPSTPQVTVVPIPDPTAQTSAPRTSEIDLATSLSSAALTTLSGTPDVKVADATLEPAFALELALNTRVAPFNDPKVQRATKLAVDQDKLANTVLGSIGEVTNDILGKGCDNYPEDVAQTVTSKEEAKHIFAGKGVMSFMIVVADVMPGMVSSAGLMAQEFAEVGVQVTVDKHNPWTYYSDLEELHQIQAAAVFWINRSPITKFRSQIMPDHPFNLSGFTSETIQQNLVKAIATLGTAEQRKLVDGINKEIHNQGGGLIWGCQEQVSAYRAGPENFTSVQSIPWLTKTTFNPVD